MTIIDNFIYQHCDNFNEYIKVKDQIMDLLDDAKDLKSRMQLIRDKERLETRYFKEALKSYAVELCIKQKHLCIDELRKSNVLDNPNVVRLINNTPNAVK